MGFLAIVTKEPSEVFDLTHDFTNRLPSGDTLTGPITITATDMADLSDATATIIEQAAPAPALDGTSKMVVFWVKAGDDGKTYKIQVKVTTAAVNPRKFESNQMLKVKEN